MTVLFFSRLPLYGNVEATTRGEFLPCSFFLWHLLLLSVLLLPPQLLTCGAGLGAVGADVGIVGVEAAGMSVDTGAWIWAGWA